MKKSVFLLFLLCFSLSSTAQAQEYLLQTTAPSITDRVIAPASDQGSFSNARKQAKMEPTVAKKAVKAVKKGTDKKGQKKPKAKAVKKSSKKKK